MVSAVGAPVEAADCGVELEFASGDDRIRARLAECGGMRFEDAVPVRPFRWSRAQEHFPDGGGWPRPDGTSDMSPGATPAP